MFLALPHQANRSTSRIFQSLICLLPDFQLKKPYFSNVLPQLIPHPILNMKAVREVKLIFKK